MKPLDVFFSFPLRQQMGYDCCSLMGHFIFPEETSFQGLHSYSKLHSVFSCFIRVHSSSVRFLYDSVHIFHRLLLPPAVLGHAGDTDGQPAWGLHSPPAAWGMSHVCGASGIPTRVPVAQVHSKPGEARLWRRRQTIALTISLWALAARRNGAAQGAQPGPVGRGSGRSG